MKLYELKRGDMFRLSGETKVPPGEVPPSIAWGKSVFKHENIDGMYSRNYDAEGNVHYFAAWTDVEVVK